MLGDSRAGASLGPGGPFPSISLEHELDRRWLHYAFLSRERDLGMVANVSWLGPDPHSPRESGQQMAILLIHSRDDGWSSSQFNAAVADPPWSAFRLPHAVGEPGMFALTAAAGAPFVRLRLHRTSRPCTSQCASFANNQHFRWQSEAGVVARGDWGFGQRVRRDVEAIGYHERVRGHWGWPEMGGWVFGFANDPEQTERGAPPTAVVFTLLQPTSPPDAPTGSVMLWRDGRLRRHFPRRDVSVAVRGSLSRDRVSQVPALANLFGVPPTAPIPHRLVIAAEMGPDRVLLDFTCESAARIVIPNETGIDPFGVHEVVGSCHVEGRCAGVAFAFETAGIVEFAGGAGGR